MPSMRIETCCAGKRLNLSASAVSHALTRLRQVVGDELFVRTPGGMTPTARADAMAQDLTDSLNRIAATLCSAPQSKCRRAFLNDSSRRSR